MKYNYYEYDGSVIVATDGSIRDNNIHRRILWQISWI